LFFWREFREELEVERREFREELEVEEIFLKKKL
jgi:hypothetical protein